MPDTANTTNNLEAFLAADSTIPAKVYYTIATFNSTRIANGHSIEMLAKGILDFRILHRFGTLNSGFENFFGLDGATTKLAFDYGLTNWLMIGIGRSSYLKEYDGYAKLKLLRQREDNRIPIGLCYLGGVSVLGNRELVQPGQEFFFSNRVAYVHQLLIARKFHERLSLQIMPTLIHYNLVDYKAEPNNVLAIGAGGRLKLSKRFSLTGEYYFQIPGYRLINKRNALSVGVDIETGGHVFQLLFTNATGLGERNVIGNTTASWTDGDVRFGFNISRVFTIVKPKDFKGSRNKIW